MRTPAPCGALEGRYRIDGLLGVGGMGRVYRARQLGTDRDVALKVVRRDEETGAGRARFRDEAAILARLCHPNIVTIFDFLEADDGDGPVDYLAMELVEGVSLDELLRERKCLPWPMVAAIAAQVASALDHAHSRGVVHRDLKPGNVAVVDPNDDTMRVCLLDFGVAKLVGHTRARNRTRPGLVVGTPAYMSPEQAAAYPDIDGRTDIYACSVVLYQCLTGIQPFQSDKPLETLDRIIRGGATAVADIRTEIPEVISQAVDRGMRVEREARYATAIDMIEALEGKVSTSTHESWEASTASFDAPVFESKFDDVTARIPPMNPPRKR